MTYRLGVDVGGTFTDLLLFDESSGAFWRHKTPSTRSTITTIRSARVTMLRSFSNTHGQTVTAPPLGAEAASAAPP